MSNCAYVHEKGILVSQQPHTHDNQMLLLPTSLHRPARKARARTARRHCIEQHGGAPPILRVCETNKHHARTHKAHAHTQSERESARESESKRAREKENACEEEWGVGAAAAAAAVAATTTIIAIAIAITIAKQ